MSGHDYTPADALPEGQAAALAFALAVVVFFGPFLIGVFTGWLSETLIWASAGFALAVFIVAWIALTRTEDKRTWPATVRPADWEDDTDLTERTSA